MSAAQRNKGACGERELFNLLTDNLGFVVKRNLSQTRGGGADGLDVPGFAIEVKRQEKLALSAWWHQTVEQAGPGRTPILFYRQSRQPWRAVIDLSDLDPSTYTDPHIDTAIVSFDAAMTFMRERIRKGKHHA
jgi:hypothetical protein